MSRSDVSTSPSSMPHGHQSGIPSPTLPPKSLSSRPPPSATFSRPMSPAIHSIASSVVMIPSIGLAVQRQQRQRQPNHVRSHSLPSLDRPYPRSVEVPVAPVNLVRDSLQSASTTNLMTQRRESMLTAQIYCSYIPNSPRLKPLISPGPVTPMQLEEDLDYQFPNVTTSIRHSPLIIPITFEEEEPDSEEILEMPQRSRQ